MLAVIETAPMACHRSLTLAACVAHLYYQVPWSEPSALVVGAEAEGLSAAAREDLAAGVITGVHVPLASGVESLNAAVAGAVILGEAQRQRAIAAAGGGGGGDGGCGSSRSLGGRGDSTGA
jgi:tRNA(Leu) C34 or U34 (ribose-2'-O)-methylase TrmL